MIIHPSFPFLTFHSPTSISWGCLPRIVLESLSQGLLLGEPKQTWVTWGHDVALGAEEASQRKRERKGSCIPKTLILVLMSTAPHFPPLALQVVIKQMLGVLEHKVFQNLLSEICNYKASWYLLLWGKDATKDIL